MNSIRPRSLSTILLLLCTAAHAELVDRAAERGLDFVHFNGMTGQTLFPEMMGAGAALVDVDRDGDLDLYLVQGKLLGEGLSLDQAVFKPEPGTPLTDRLYRNDLSNGVSTFVDISQQSGLQVASGYGMGVTVIDVNNDGWPDLYRSGFGSNQLLVNDGKGRFVDQTESWGADDDRWSVTAIPIDYDADGWMDLYVVNYVNFSFSTQKTCRSNYDAPDYCSPQSYKAVADRMLRNVEGKRFDNVTSLVGIGTVDAPGLGGVAGDFNGDGLTDLYIANDGASNLLWLNQDKRTFIDDALMAGVAVNMTGTPEASMGVDAADFDADGDLDLFMTHLNRQTNTLYVNDGKGWFMDTTGRSVLGSSSFAYTGFGTRWFDLDNDGWLDLFSANGAVVKIESQDREGDPFPLRQYNQLWRNTGDGQYEDVSADHAGALQRLRVSRGAAFGDVDNDGDTDIVVTNNSGPVELLINEQQGGHHWIGLDLRLHDGRPAWGAEATIAVGDRLLKRRSRTDGSYVCAHDSRILAGLATHAGPADIEIRWPDGTTQSIKGLSIDRYHTLEQPKS